MNLRLDERRYRAVKGEGEVGATTAYQADVAFELRFDAAAGRRGASSVRRRRVRA